MAPPCPCRINTKSKHHTVGNDAEEGIEPLKKGAKIPWGTFGEEFDADGDKDRHLPRVGASIPRYQPAHFFFADSLTELESVERMRGCSRRSEGEGARESEALPLEGERGRGGEGERENGPTVMTSSTPPCMTGMTLATTALMRVRRLLKRRSVRTTRRVRNRRNCLTAGIEAKAICATLTPERCQLALSSLSRVLHPRHTRAASSSPLPRHLPRHAVLVTRAPAALAFSRPSIKRPPPLLPPLLYPLRFLIASSCSSATAVRVHKRHPTRARCIRAAEGRHSTLRA